MTNREWLATLSDEDFIFWMTEHRGCESDWNTETGIYEIVSVYPFYPTKYEICAFHTNSNTRLLEWFKEERKDPKEMLGIKDDRKNKNNEIK